MAELRSQGLPDEVIGDAVGDFLDIEQEVRNQQAQDADARYWNGLDPDNPLDDF